MLTTRNYKFSIPRPMASLGSRVFSREPAVRTLIVYNLLQGMYLGYIRIFWQPWMVSIGISVAIIARGSNIKVFDVRI